MAAGFSHLHVHTEFSMLDGAARIRDVVAAAVADGQPAVGITDHGNMYGVLDFYKECRAQGVTPIIGLEAYQAGESRFERPVRRGRMDDSGGEDQEGEKLYYHLTLLAESNAGYRNLMKLSSTSYLEGFFYKPRCLVAGQEIVTRGGVTPIEEIEVGDEVMTHRGRFRRVTRKMSRHHSGPVYGIRLGGRYERVTWMTGEHPVLVRLRDGTTSWVEAKALRSGRPGDKDGLNQWLSWACLPKVQREQALERIDVPGVVGWHPAPERPGYLKRTTPRQRMGPTSHYSQFPESLPLDYDLGHFMGLFVAEGHTSPNEVVWSFPRDEFELIDRCSIMAEKLVGRAVTIDRHLNRPDYLGVSVRCSSTVLAKLLSELCGKGAKNKHLPAFVFDAPREFQQGLVDGVLDGDGSIKPTTIIFTQTSRDLAWQMRMLQALLHDDFGCVTEMELPSEQHANQYRINFSPRQAQQYRRTIADDCYVYRPITAVEERQYDGPVFNIEVEDDHSYVSDFAIHNCDWELLERHHEGVIATTGCLGGVVLQALLAGDVERATALGARLQEIFGKESLFVELQDHGLAKQHKTNPQLIELARRIGAPLLATNDSHYTHREDATAHDALLCVQTGSSLADEKRFRFEGNEHYLKSSTEMRQLFGEAPEACDNTLWIAERADVEIEFGNPKLPQFELPPPFESAADYLRNLTFEGAKERYGVPLPAEVTERLDYELGVISSMGFPDYFLVVWDLIRHARERKIRVGPGRGSAAGSCVAYCLRIVDLDPLRFGLIFERFLNPGRTQMPDIDMDFDSRYRGEMIRYASERYGWDRVAQIVTFSTIKARAAVRDAARVLGYPYIVGDKVAKAMPPLVMGRDTPLHACLEQTDGHGDGYRAAGELRDMYATDPDARKVIDVAKGLEGLRRQDGIHAAAVVITDEPLTEYLPIQRKPQPGGTPEDAPIVTQYEMHGVEELGLLKMDFLGLRNLDVIEMTLDLLESSTGVRPDIDRVPLDDEKTFEMLRAGLAIGLFQLEGGPVRQLLRQMAPTRFEEIAAIVALYRPGPMANIPHFVARKHGREPITYLHPDLEPILGKTYGVLVYQESVIEIAHRIAGFALPRADEFRRAVGKKKREVVAAQKDDFLAGCVAQGYEAKLAERLFALIEPFADYGFNASHAYGYALIAYQTAWLKANHAVEYLAALLTSVKDDKDKTAIYLSECRTLGISVLVPDVNVSASGFAAREGAIPFGLSAIRNVGEGLVERIVAEREAKGPFTDFYDFCERVDPMVLNKRTVESLVKAGGFDSMGHPRRGLCLVFEQVIDRTLARRRKESEGQFDLFSFDDGSGGGAGAGNPASDERIPIPDAEFEKAQKLAFEKEMLGLYVSDHPLKGAEVALRRLTEASIAEVRELPDGEVRWVGGVVTNLARRYTKKGDLMATFLLEDLESVLEVWMFPRVMQEYGSLLADDAIVCVKGRLDLREEQVKLTCLEVRRPELTPEGTTPLRVALPLSRLTDSLVNQLKRLFLDHPGPQPVLLQLGEKTLRLPEQFCVDASNGLCAELRVLLGAACLG
ncbi:MAG TPA: DNA polymerase III subunit alpha [Acidimicrobiales bacterium]|nr:DNA polymerase III subunit alpha [Acidimicrobiales bacterium]